MKTMKVEQLTGLETINLMPATLWNAPPFIEIDIKPDCDKVKENATTLLSSLGRVIHSDASG
jgi:hypothetical protein